MFYFARSVFVAFQESVVVLIFCRINNNIQKLYAPIWLSSFFATLLINLSFRDHFTQETYLIQKLYAPILPR